MAWVDASHGGNAPADAAYLAGRGWIVDSGANTDVAGADVAGLFFNRSTVEPPPIVRGLAP